MFYVFVYVAYGAGFGIIVAAPIDTAYTIRARYVDVSLISDYDVQCAALCCAVAASLTPVRARAS
jgi:hypothetical protein